jgi:hypothetical protein
MAQKMNVQVSTTKPAVGVPFEIAFHLNAIPQDFTPPLMVRFHNLFLSLTFLFLKKKDQ